jgi:radical SAM superfamily enzyme YgiQ (UPF0313 family)
MNRIVLVYPPFQFTPPTAWPPLCPPLVIAHLHAALEAAQVGQVESLDLDLEHSQHGTQSVDSLVEKDSQRILGLDPTIIAMSCKTAQFPFAALLTRSLKQQEPKVRVVMGGWMPTLAPEQTIRLSGCDAVVRGEGEKTLPELIKRINEDEWMVPGVSYRTADARIVHNPNSEVLTATELDNIPLPRYDALPPITSYQPARTNHAFTVEASRGCANHQCIFCWNSTRNCDATWRAKSPRRVAKEMKYLYDNWGARLFFFSDDSFGAESTWLRGFTSTMQGTFRPGSLAYIASMRVDSIIGKGIALRDLFQSGLRTIFHGIESGSPQMWNTLGKNYEPVITRERIFDLASKELAAGIVPIFSFMIGLPNETEQDLDSTVSMCEQLARLGSLFAFHILAPYQGTELYERHKNLIEAKDMIKEFGESESFLPEFHKVFGTRLNEFTDYLPDYHWVHPTVPLETFTQKYHVLDRIVSSEQMSPYKQYDLQRHPEAEHQIEQDLKQRAKLTAGNKLKATLRSLRGKGKR